MTETQLTLPDEFIPKAKGEKPAVKPYARRTPRPTEQETPMTTIVQTEESGGRALATTLADLEATAHARSTDPSTSHLAAASVHPTASQVSVLVFFRHHDDEALRWMDRTGGGLPLSFLAGYTDEALADAMEAQDTPLSPSRIRTARKELQRAGLLEPTGERRPTKRGRLADVYDLTEAGRAFDLS